MARKNESPQKAAMREMMKGYLKENDISIKDGTDVNAVMRDMMSVLLEGVPDQEPDEELGYSKYDYRNKDTDNSRNGHSTKTMHTSYGDMEMAVPRDRNGDYEPQLIKKYLNTVTQDMEEKILSMYAKGMTTGEKIKHFRNLRGISQETLGQLSGINSATIKKYEYGIRNPKPDQLMKIANAFGCPNAARLFFICTTALILGSPSTLPTNNTLLATARKSIEPMPRYAALFPAALFI